MQIQSNIVQPFVKFNVFRGSQENSLPETAPISSEPKEKQKTSNTSSSVAIAAIATVMALFALSKGFQKNTNKVLNKIKDFFEAKLAHTSVNDSVKRKSFYEFFIRRINSFIQKSESINNITSLKDVLFMKLMYKTKPTKKIHESISKYFEKISQKTVFKSYEKTEKQFNKMNKLFDELDEYILKHNPDEKVEYTYEKLNEEGKLEWVTETFTKRELVEKAREKRDYSNTMVDVFIIKPTIKYRYNYINDATSSLYSTFWDASFKDFWSKNNKFKRKEMWQTFIAAEQIKLHKLKIADCSSASRNAITYTNDDETGKVYEYIKSLDNIIPPKDTEGIEIMKKLKWFVKNPDIFGNNKDLFLEELDKLEAHKFPQNSNSKVMQALETYKHDNIQHIIKQIKDNKKGLLQEMLLIYYKIAPFELEKSGALLSLKKAVKMFDKSLNLEGNEFFDKVRDLRLGSAPTDVLTILISFITLSIGLGHAKDKDKRTSIMLKSGIPIVGGIATAMFSAARLVAGGKSLALGLLSGIVLNRVGVIADNMRKHKIEKEEDAKRILV